MKPISIRQNLHTFIDLLPTVKLTEIYYLLKNNYRDEFKLALPGNFTEIEMSADETELIMQQLLS